MPTYDIDEGRLVVPTGWEDRSLNRLVYPDRGEEKQGTLHVLVNRQPARSRTLPKIVDEVVTSMRRRLAGFELVTREEVLIDDEPAIVLSIRYTDEGKPYHQRSIWMLVGKKCATVGVVATPDVEAEADATFEQIRGSLRKRRPDRDEVPIEAAPPPVPPHQS